MRTRLLLLGGLATAGLALAVADQPAPARAPVADFAALPAWDVTGQLWTPGDRPVTQAWPPATPADDQLDAPTTDIWATPATFSASD